MQTLEKAFILNSLKYSETSLIINVYTENFGRKAFIYKGFFKRKKQSKALVFPLTEVQIQYSSNQKSNLFSIYNISNSNLIWKTLHTNPIKSSIILFLSEVLSSVLREEEQNKSLYQFISKQFRMFDEKSKCFSEFHLNFLLELTKHLGFYPNVENNSLDYFDLQQGSFTTNRESNHTIENENLKLFKNLLNSHFNIDSKHQFKQRERNTLISILLEYYKIHLTEFKEPKSLNVLQTIFSED